MSELQVGRSTQLDAATVAGLGSGAIVFGVLLMCLLRPESGRYVTEAIAALCALAATGIALFAAAVSERYDVSAGLRKPAIVLSVAAFAAALVTLPFAIMAVSGDGMRGLGDGLARSAALRSGNYETIVVRGVGLVLVVGGLRRRPNTRSRVVLVLGASLVVGSFLLTGHARTHGPAVAVLVTEFAHVAAAAGWFGGLLALGLSLRRRRDDPVTCAHLLSAFARTMQVVLVALLAAGVGLAVLFLPSPSALVDTAYGDVLLVKLAVVATVLVLSTANHFRLVPAARTGNMSAVRVLRTNIAAEQVLLIAVLAITEVLSRQNPG